MQEPGLSCKISRYVSIDSCRSRLVLPGKNIIKPGGRLKNDLFHSGRTLSKYGSDCGAW